MRSVDDRTRRRAGCVADLRPWPPQWHVQLSDWHGPEGLQAVLDVARDGQLHFCRCRRPKENEKRFISHWKHFCRKTWDFTRNESRVVNGGLFTTTGPQSLRKSANQANTPRNPGIAGNANAQVHCGRSFELIIVRRFGEASPATNKLLMSKNDSRVISWLTHPCRADR